MEREFFGLRFPFRFIPSKNIPHKEEPILINGREVSNKMHLLRLCSPDLKVLSHPREDLTTNEQWRRS